MAFTNFLKHHSKTSIFQTIIKLINIYDEEEEEEEEEGEEEEEEEEEGEEEEEEEG